jgi:HK97 family phage portal protein
MSILFGRERRSISYQDVWGSGATWDQFTTDKALALVPVYAATRFLADSVASLPARTYRQVGELREPTRAPMLFSNPAPYGTPYDWWHRCMVSLLLRGNAYGVVTSFDNAMFPRTVEWVHPDSVSVDESGMTPVYRHRGGVIPRENMIHVVAYAQPGRFVGLSPVSAFKLTMETGYRAQESTRDWYRRAGKPMGHLKNSSKILIPDEASTAKKRYRDSVKDGDILVTGSDWDLKPITVSAQDAQFLAAIKATATQVASIYGVSPERIGGETGKSLTYSTVEGDTLHELTWAVRPWLVRLEQVFTQLLPRPQFLRFNADAMIRVDLKSRYEAHQISLQNEWQTINEVRALEDKPPVSWGDEPRPKQPVQAQRSEPPIRVETTILEGAFRADVDVDARTEIAEGAVQSPVTISEGAVRMDVEIPVDATTALTEDSIRVDVDARTEVVAGERRAVRKTVETDERGRITAITEEPADE